MQDWERDFEEARQRRDLAVRELRRAATELSDEELQRFVDDFLNIQWITMPTTGSVMYQLDCKLPNNEHSLYVSTHWQCQADTAHVLCKTHQFTQQRCPLDADVLR
jgi:hypothetical protein